MRRLCIPQRIPARLCDAGAAGRATSGIAASNYSSNNSSALYHPSEREFPVAGQRSRPRLARSKQREHREHLRFDLSSDVLTPSFCALQDLSRSASRGASAASECAVHKAPSSAVGMRHAGRVVAARRSRSPRL